MKGVKVYIRLKSSHMHPDMKKHPLQELTNLALKRQLPILVKALDLKYDMASSVNMPEVLPSYCSLRKEPEGPRGEAAAWALRCACRSICTVWAQDLPVCAHLQQKLLRTKPSRVTAQHRRHIFFASFGNLPHDIKRIKSTDTTFMTQSQHKPFRSVFQ